MLEVALRGQRGRNLEKLPDRGFHNVHRLREIVDLAHDGLDAGGFVEIEFLNRGGLRAQRS